MSFSAGWIHKDAQVSPDIVLTYYGGPVQVIPMVFITFGVTRRTAIRAEIGDICAWQNIQNDPFGSKSYTMQPMFSNATQSCVHSY